MSRDLGILGENLKIGDFQASILTFMHLNDVVVRPTASHKLNNN